MMISPDSYMEMLKDKSYTDLIQCRDHLITSVRQFEQNERKGDRSDPSWNCRPSPDVVYQMQLEYLSRLCSFMKEKYNEEYVWGGRTLKQDEEDAKNGC